MAHPPTNKRLDPNPDLLRRLKEFQVQLREVPTRRKLDAVVPARGPLSGQNAAILARLRKLSGDLADSLEQALTDLNDGTRLTYIGPVGEAREVLRATIQLLAPDEEIRKQPWFVGIKQGQRTNPSQAERMRYAVQRRGGHYQQLLETTDMVEERMGRLSRLVYQRASAGFHTDGQQREARLILGYVFLFLDDVLPD
jgi:hypothetical protein